MYSGTDHDHRKKKRKEIFSSDLNSLAVRVPNHNDFIKILNITGVPISAPSANLSGKPSITDFDTACNIFLGKVDLIFKGIEPEFGIESTILSTIDETPVLIRPGSLGLTKLQHIFPSLEIKLENNFSKTVYPGMKYRHYSPNGKVYVVEKLPDIIYPKTAQIGFDRKSKSDLDEIIGSNQEYMKKLYYFFNICDKIGIENIYCEIPKKDEFEITILNRLYKSSM